MLTTNQKKFANSFLSPLKQRFFFIKKLPMAILSGTRLEVLSANEAVARVPYFWWNKNPFNSMYFAVQSMAAELSTAAPAMLALKGVDKNCALIIVDMRADFVKKAQSKVTFTCTDYPKFAAALHDLQPGKANQVTAKTIGTNQAGEVVATFFFTWSFKYRA